MEGLTQARLMEIIKDEVRLSMGKATGRQGLQRESSFDSSSPSHFDLEGALLAIVDEYATDPGLDDRLAREATLKLVRNILGL